MIAPHAIHLDNGSKFKCKVKNGKCQTLRHYAKDAPRVSVYSLDSKILAYRECVRYFAGRERTKLQGAQKRDEAAIERLKTKMAERRVEMDTLQSYITDVCKKQKVAAWDDDE